MPDGASVEGDGAKAAHPKVNAALTGTTTLWPAEALVNLARRYCSEHFNYWAKQYQAEQKKHTGPQFYTDRDFDLFPRYNVLNAILLEILAVTGRATDEKWSLAECREFLALAGEAGETAFTKKPQNGIEARAMREERESFIAYIAQVTDDDLRRVEPLPYNRLLGKMESEKIRARLLASWNFDGGYWEPLEARCRDKVCFLATENVTAKDYERIADYVISAAGGKIYYLTEYHEDYQCDRHLFDPKDCYESVYCDESLDWIVYGSHEGTIAFGGSALIDFIKRLFFFERQNMIDRLPAFWENKS